MLKQATEIEQLKNALTMLREPADMTPEYYRVCAQLHLQHTMSTDWNPQQINTFPTENHVVVRTPEVCISSGQDSAFETDINLDMFEVSFLESSSGTSSAPALSSDESLSEHPAKRFKLSSLSSLSVSLCAAMTTATTSIATTLFNCDSHAMLSLEDDADCRTTAAHVQPTAVCKAENSSAPGFSTGSASGHRTDLSDRQLLDEVDQNSNIEVSVGWMYSIYVTMFGIVLGYTIWSFRRSNIDNWMLDYGIQQFAPVDPLGDSTLPQSRLSLVCLMGSISCSHLPVWAKRFLRKLSLDDSHKANEVRAGWTVTYYVYVLPWFQAALAFQTYRESGSIRKAITGHLVTPCFVVALALLTHGHGVSIVRRAVLFIGFPIFCILQETAPYEFWCVEIARWHLQGVVTNTSLIVPLQESLFILAAMFVVSPTRLATILSIVVAGIGASCAKILWIRRNNPNLAS